MYNMNNFVKHIEHLGFYVLMKLDKKDESILYLEDSLLLLSNISKIRKFLKSKYNYDLSWTTTTLSLNNEICDIIKLTVIKNNEQELRIASF